jgi:hypothetical protein
MGPLGPVWSENGLGIFRRKNMHPSTFLLTAVLLVTSASAQQDRRKYDEKADAAAAIDSARSKAAAENRRVLIVWGADESEPCKKLDGLFAEDEGVREKLRYEYDVVRVDASNVELARRCEADVEKAGIPFLTVLDAKGAVLANQPAGALGAKPLLDFLTRNQAPYEKAEDVRARALKETAAAGKKLLLTFGAPW